MDNPKFEFYPRPNGHNEFMEFYHSLPSKDQEKLMTLISMVQDKGLLVAQRMEWVKNWTRKSLKFALNLPQISRELYIFIYQVIALS